MTEWPGGGFDNLVRWVLDRTGDHLDARLTPVRRFIRNRPGWFAGYQSVLRRAAITEPYDRFLAEAIGDGLIGGFFGGLLAAAVGGAAVVLVPISRSPLAVASIIAGTAVIGALVGFLPVVGWRMLTPVIRASRRRTRINGVLPYGMILIYSLARGGMGFQHITDVLAEAQSTYGELAVEFARIRRDTRHFGMNQLAALRAAQERSPSSRFDDFLDDLSSVVEAGTGFPEFMATQTRHQLERMRRDQKSLLQTLETFAETYIVVVFVAPLFALVLLVLLSFIGADTVPVIKFIIYVDLPLATAGAIVLAGRLEGARTVPSGLDVRPIGGDQKARRPPDDEVVRRYNRATRLATLRRRLGHPVTEALRRPTVTLVVTIPLMLLVAAGIGASEGIGLSPAAYRSQPVLVTAILASLFLVPAVPLSAFHELKRRREREMVAEFPAVLQVIADANEVGLDLVESFDVVARRLDGPIPDELRRAYEDVQLTGDVEQALADMTDRVRSPEIRLATKILLEGYKSTRDLSDVLDTLSAALESRYELMVDLRRAMRLYVFILVLGVLTFLGIVFSLNQFFFPPLEEVSGQLSELETDQLLLRPTDIPIIRYQTLLFHAALIQAAGNGLLMGKLVDDRALSGLKYVVGLVIVVLVVFLAL